MVNGGKILETRHKIFCYYLEDAFTFIIYCLSLQIWRQFCLLTILNILVTIAKINLKITFGF